MKRTLHGRAAVPIALVVVSLMITACRDQDTLGDDGGTGLGLQSNPEAQSSAGGRAETGEKLSYQRGSYGWVADLPDRFMGKPVTVSIETGDYKGPDPDSVSLLENRILPVLPALLQRAEAELRAYEKDDPDFAEHVHEPHVWIHAEAAHPDEWTFVVGRDDWETFGWHLEFKDRVFLEIWAGS